jgi:hypothetical protein
MTAVAPLIGAYIPIVRAAAIIAASRAIPRASTWILVGAACTVATSSAPKPHMNFHQRLIRIVALDCNNSVQVGPRTFSAIHRQTDTLRRERFDNNFRRRIRVKGEPIRLGK